MGVAGIESVACSPTEVLFNVGTVILSYCGANRELTRPRSETFGHERRFMWRTTADLTTPNAGVLLRRIVRCEEVVGGTVLRYGAGMVSWGHLTAFTVASFVLVIVPGPSVIFTIGRALSVGRRDALLTVAGDAAGVYLQVVAVAFGVGALVEHSLFAFTVIKFAGAAYLVFLGVQAIRHRHSIAAALAARQPATGTSRALLDGFVVGAANPKSVVFLAAVLPEFTDPISGHVPVQLLVLGAVFSVVAWLCTSVWAMIAGTARTWLARSPRRLAAIGGTGGLAMIGLGVGLAISGRTH